MEHLSNALKAVFKEQDGDEVLFCADMLQRIINITVVKCHVPIRR